MYPGQTLTVQVRNPYYFERYFMDYQSGQLALAPDVASTIIGPPLLTPLQKASEIHGFEQNQNRRLPCTVANIQAQPLKHRAQESPHRITFTRHALANFAEAAKGIYRSLEPAVALGRSSRKDRPAPPPGNDAMKAILSP